MISMAPMSDKIHYQTQELSNIVNKESKSNIYSIPNRFSIDSHLDSRGGGTHPAGGILGRCTRIHSPTVDPLIKSCVVKNEQNETVSSATEAS